MNHVPLPKCPGIFPVQAAPSSSHTRSNCSSSTSISSRGCDWEVLKGLHHGWTSMEACLPPLVLCAEEEGAASTSTPEFTGSYVSAHLPNGLCPQGHDILGLRCPGTQLEVGSAYLFLSLMWGGHGWVEGVARFCGASSGPSVQSGSLLDLRRTLEF